MDPNVFGLSNGVVTVLSVITGMTATGASRKAIISALMALLIADPLMDAYAISLSISEPEESRSAGIRAFISQFVVQLSFILIMVLVPSQKVATGVSIAVGALFMGAYGNIYNVDAAGQVRLLSILFAIMGISYYSNYVVAPYLN